MFRDLQGLRALGPELAMEKVGKPPSSHRGALKTRLLGTPGASVSEGKAVLKTADWLTVCLRS